MSWERDSLWSKSRLFFERAFDESREDPLFGLWCSLGIELLGRAALASVSPTLLAEPAPDHRYLLHALNRGSEKIPRKSISTGQVFGLCRILFDSFSDEDLSAALALINRRNDELHTGTAAFDKYPSKVWLPGFYRACESLAKSMGESLKSLFGKEEAKIAARMISEFQKEAKQRVLSAIAAHRRVFEAKSPKERASAGTMAKQHVAKLSHRRHHTVTCPACGCAATVQGEPFGVERVSDEGGLIVVRRSMSPRSFSCSGCDLKLLGYAELHAAELGGQYTRRTEFSPEEYYGLINPESADLTKYIEDYLAEMANEYDNE
jgi:hypothetical protein